MTFPISAWGPDGRTVVKREGPLRPNMLDNGGFVTTPAERAKHLRFRLRRSSTFLPETAGRADPTLGNLLHAGMCGGE